ACCLPWLKVAVALRYVCTFPWAPEAWREVRQHIPWLLAEQARLRRAGWFNLAGGGVDGPSPVPRLHGGGAPRRAARSRSEAAAEGLAGRAPRSWSPPREPHHQRHDPPSA